MNTKHITPTWAELKLLIENGNEEIQAAAWKEIRKMAKAADKWNEHVKWEKWTDKWNAYVKQTKQ